MGNKLLCYNNYYTCILMMYYTCGFTPPQQNGQGFCWKGKHQVNCFCLQEKSWNFRTSQLRKKYSNFCSRLWSSKACFGLGDILFPIIWLLWHGKWEMQVYWWLIFKTMCNEIDNNIMERKKLKFLKAMLHFSGKFFFSMNRNPNKKNKPRLTT